MNTFDALLTKLDAEIAEETAREKEARELTGETDAPTRLVSALATSTRPASTG